VVMASYRIEASLDKYRNHLAGSIRRLVIEAVYPL
jgi:hypothetical protein